MPDSAGDPRNRCSNATSPLPQTSVCSRLSPPTTSPPHTSASGHRPAKRRLRSNAWYTGPSTPSSSASGSAHSACHESRCAARTANNGPSPSSSELTNHPAVEASSSGGNSAHIPPPQHDLHRKERPRQRRLVRRRHRRRRAIRHQPRQRNPPAAAPALPPTRSPPSQTGSSIPRVRSPHPSLPKTPKTASATASTQTEFGPPQTAPPLHTRQTALPPPHRRTAHSTSVAPAAPSIGVSTRRSGDSAAAASGSIPAFPQRSTAAGDKTAARQRTPARSPAPPRSPPPDRSAVAHAVAAAPSPVPADPGVAMWREGSRRHLRTGHQRPPASPPAPPPARRISGIAIDSSSVPSRPGPRLKSTSLAAPSAPISAPSRVQSNPPPIGPADTSPCANRLSSSGDRTRR